MVEMTLYPSTWRVSRGSATGGAFTLTYRGNTTTAIAYNATAAEVKSALVNLADDYTFADWFVSGEAGGPWIVVTPSGKLFGTGSLTGGTLSVTVELPPSAANYGSLAVWAGKTQEDWEDELRGREVTRWGSDGVLGALFQGLNAGKPFVAALLEAVIQETFGDDGLFATVSEARAAARVKFENKWEEILTAQGTASAARRLARLRARSGNNFISDSKALFAESWTQTGVERSGFVAKSGTHSVLMTRAAGDRYLWFNTADDGTVEPILTRSAECFYVECFVYDGGNLAYGAADLVVKAINSASGAATETVVDTITFTSQTRGSWRKLRGYYTMPSSGYDTISVGVKLPGNALIANDVVYVDDMLCREATDIQISWNRFWDGLNGTSGSTGKGASDVESAAGVVRGWARGGFRASRARIKAGTNLISDPNFDDAGFWTQPSSTPVGSVQVGSETIAPRTGDYNLRITSQGSTATEVWFNTIDDGTVEPIKARVGELYYLEAYVLSPTANANATVRLVARVSKAGAGTGNPADIVVDTQEFTVLTEGQQWQKLSGYVRIPAGYNELSAGLILPANLSTSGNVFFADDAMVRETSAAQRLIDVLFDGFNGTTGSFGKDPDEVYGSMGFLNDGTKALRLARQRAKVGPNFVNDPRVENTEYWNQTSVAQSELHRRSGRYSLEVTRASAATYCWWNTIDDGTIQPISTWLDDSLYFQCWYYAPTQNGTGTLQLVVKAANSYTGATVETVLDTITVAEAGAWKKISAVYVMPEGADSFSAGVKLDATVSNYKVYLDSLLIREATATQRLFGINRLRLRMGSNLVTDPNFDDAGFWTQTSAAQVGSVVVGTETIAPRTGSYSLQVTSQGAAPTEVYFNTSFDGAVERIKTRAGELFYVEAYCYSPEANSNATVELIARVHNAKDGNSLLVTVDSQSFTALTEKQWTKLSGYVKVPVGYNQISAGVRLPANLSTAGNVFLVDDALLRETTAAQRMIDALFDGFNSSTGSFGKDPDDVYGSMGLVQDGPKALRLARQRAKVGSNFVTDPRIEDVGYWQQTNSSRSDLYRRGGKYSLEVKAATLGTYVWWNTIDGGTVEPVSTWLDDSLFMQCFYYAPTQTGTATMSLVVKAVNSYTGVEVETVLKTVTVQEGGVGWNKFNGVYTMPEGADGFSAGVKVTSATANYTVYLDSLLIREATAAQRLTDNIHQALTGQTGTGKSDDDVSTGMRSVFAKLFDGLSGNAENTNTSKSGFELFAAAKQARERAETGVTTATDAATFAGEILESGANLIANSDFESGSVSPQPLVGTYSTDQAYSGSRSLKITASGATKTFYLLSSGLTPRTLTVSPDDVFLCEFWVYGSGITQSVADGLRLVIEPINRLGGNLTEVYAGQTVSTALNGTWTKVSQLVTLPPENTVSPLQTVAKMKVSIQLRNTVTAGTVYIDQCSVREVTINKLLGDGAVTTPKIGAAAVTTAKVGDNQVTNAKVSTDIDATKITAGQLPEARIGSLSAGKITSGTFGEAFIADSAVTSGKIGPLAVIAGKIAANAVTNSEVSADIDGTKITAGTIAEVRIAQLSQSKVTGLPTDYEVSGTLLSHTQKIQALEAASDASSAQGKLMTVNFANYTNGTLPPSLFTVTYPSGAGTSTIQVTNGMAGWVAGSLADRTAKIIYVGDTDGKTYTNFQTIKGTLGAIPGFRSGYTGPKFSAIGRVSDDGNSYVWARAYFSSGMTLLGEIGCTINGAETIWRSNIPLTWSVDMTFNCGANGNPRAYQVYSGTTLVTSYEEGFSSLAAFPSPGTTGRLYVANDTGLRYTWNGSAYVSSASLASYLGDSTKTSNYRRWGSIVEIKNLGGTLYSSGAVSAVSTSDAEPSAYSGSVAKMARTSATTVTLASGENALPSSFFVTNYETLDVNSDDVNGTFTVNKSKMYVITSRVKVTTNLEAMIAFNLQKKNTGTSTWVTIQKGPTHWANDGLNTLNAVAYTSGESIAAQWIEYLNAGDEIRLATYRSTGSSSCLAGESTGAETYFCIAGLT